MGMRFMPYIMLCINFALAAMAAEVIFVDVNAGAIGVSQNEAAPFHEGDVLCALKNNKPTLCGKVGMLLGSGVVLRFGNSIYLPSMSVDRLPKVGDKVIAKRSVLESKNEVLATDPNPEEKVDKKDQKTYHNFTFGVLWPKPIQPSAQYQFGFAKNFAIGLAFHVLRQEIGAGTMGAFGTTLNFHFYSKNRFEGIWLQTGVGIYGVNAKVNQHGEKSRYRFSSPAVMGTLGYRFKFDSGINIGVAAGGQYLSRWEELIPAQKFSGFLPSLVIDVGFSF